MAKTFLGVYFFFIFEFYRNLDGISKCRGIGRKKLVTSKLFKFSKWFKILRMTFYFYFIFLREFFIYDNIL